MKHSSKNWTPVIYQNMAMDSENSSGDLTSPSRPFLAFSVERILSDNFGKKRDRERDSASLSEKNSEKREREPKSSLPPHGGGSEEDMSIPNGVPVWVFCTRFSSRASSGPRRIRSKKHQSSSDQDLADDGESPRSRRLKCKKNNDSAKRPRTAFSADQLNNLKREFTTNRYLTESRRKLLAQELKLSESQIKIWFQNRRAKCKRSAGRRSPLALKLMAEGLYNHSSIAVKDDDLDERPKSSLSS